MSEIALVLSGTSLMCATSRVLDGWAVMHQQINLVWGCLHKARACVGNVYTNVALTASQWQHLQRPDVDLTEESKRLIFIQSSS